MTKIFANKKILFTVIIGLVIITVLVAFNVLRSDPQITAGQKIVVTVTAASAEDMYGYQFKMNYNKDELEYDGELTSKISEIQMIFAKPFEGYELVGATMVGDEKGVSGKNVPVCQMIFTAKKDGKLSGITMSLTEVNVVKSDLAYIEDLTDWDFKAAVQS